MLEIPVEKWHEAIRQRVSTRSYTDREITASQLDDLKETAEWLQLLCPGARAAILDHLPDDLFKPMFGPVGPKNIYGARYYAAFIGDTSSSHYNEMVGYLGEGIILHATALGLRTCWTTFFRPEVSAKQIGLKDNERVVMVTPIGYGVEKANLQNRLVARIFKSRTRKSLDELCTSTVPREEWPEWIAMGLEAARQAPSALNRQPWRFKVHERAVSLSVDRPDGRGAVSRKLDCGIAMLHFQIGALMSDALGAWEWPDDDRLAVFRRHARIL